MTTFGRGILDIPAPLFHWMDGLMAPGLPAIGRLTVWGFIAAAVSMGLYRLFSSQDTIRRVQGEAEAARIALMRYEGDFRGLLSMVRAALGLPLKHLRLVSVPALLASLPVLSLLVWLSTAYGYRPPQIGEVLEVRVSPAMAGVGWTAGTRATGAAGVWEVVWPADGKTAHLRGPGGELLLSLPMEPPVPVVHKPKWWNTLVGNPAGYLPEHSPVIDVRLQLQEREVVDFGPPWMRSWAIWFLLVLTAVSLAIKLLFRIH